MITREELHTACAGFLPSGLHTLKDPVSFSVSQETSWERVFQVCLSAMASDSETPYALQRLALDALAFHLQETLKIFDRLDETLRTLPATPYVRRDDVTLLQQARRALLSIAGGLARGTFNPTSQARFEAALTEYLEQIAEDVQANSASARAVLLEAAADLETKLAAVAAQRAQVLAVLSEWQDARPQARVAALVYANARARIEEILEALPALSTQAQGEQIRTVFLQLVAALAATQQVAVFPAAFGETVFGPVQDGATPPTYLTLESVARVDPALPLAAGEDGRLAVAGVFGSATGVLVDGSGGLSSRLEDAAVPDFTAVASVGDTLLFVDTGRAHRIAAVTSTRLTLSPATADTQATPRRYAIQAHDPGELFSSPGAAFCETFDTGTTPTALLASGSQGFFISAPRISGGGMTNLRASGGTATLRPQKASGASGSQAGTTLSDPAALFLSGGILPGDQLYVSGTNAGGNPYTVDYVASETSLEVTSAFGAADTSSWYLEDPGADQQVQQAGASFLSIPVGEVFRILSGSQTGSRTITGILSNTVLEVNGAALTLETGVDWEIPYPTTTVYAPGASFLSAGVQAGDAIVIDGVGTYEVASVLSQEMLSLTSAIPTGFSGAAWEITAAGDSVLFEELDGVDLLAAGVAPVVHIESWIDGVPVPSQAEVLLAGLVDLPVARVDSASRLRVGVAQPVAGPFAWACRVNARTQALQDVTHSFSSWSRGDHVVVYPGTSEEVRTRVEEVVSASEVRLADSLPAGRTGVPYQHSALHEDGLSLRVQGASYDVIQIVNPTTLRVRPPLPVSSGTSLPYLLTTRGSPLEGVYLSDVAGAQTLGLSGFPLDLVGRSLEFLPDPPRRATILAVLDADNDGIRETLQIDQPLRVGRRKVRYRIRDAAEGSAVRWQSGTSAAGTQAGDVLTAWTERQPFTLHAANTLETEEPARARQSGVPLVAVRGGHARHGRAILYEMLQTPISWGSTQMLRARLAQVLLDHGGAGDAITSGGSGELPVNGSGTSEVLEAQDFVADGVLPGDRVEVTYLTETRVSYVTAVLSDTQLQISPALPAGSSRPYNVTRTSVSASLIAIQQLRTPLEALLQLTVDYGAVPNATVQGVLATLEDKRLDRALSLLREGKVAEFLSLGASGATSSGYAQDLLRKVGSAVYPSPQLSPRDLDAPSQLGGADPATGSTAPANVSSTVFKQVLYDDARAVVQVARALATLRSADLARSAAAVDLETLRAEAVYALTGETLGQTVTDEGSPLPWLQQTGTRQERLDRVVAEAIAALEGIRDNPSAFQGAE